MADRILSVQTLNLTAGGPALEIDIPDRNNMRAWDDSITHRDSIAYVFDGSNTRDIELVQNENDTEGIKIALRNEKTIGGWRIVANPPKWVYQPAGGSNTSVRVTVVLLR